MTDGLGSTDVGSSRFRSLDRWLEPRWRALLTWVVLAATTAVMLDQGLFAWTMGKTRSLLTAYVLPLLPAQWSAGVAGVATAPTLMFLFCWFQPFMLRLNWSRTLIWFAINAVLGAIVFSMSIADDRWGVALLFGAIPALAGLTIVDQRTRPWMSLAAGGLAALSFAFVFSRSQLYVPLYVMTSANLIYGAVMLYGTDPLPSRPAERQPGENPR